MKKFLAVIIGMVTFPVMASDISAGIYDSLLIAKSKSGDISGYYQESIGRDSDPTCSFYFYGHDNQRGTILINSWSSVQKKGYIKSSDTGVVLKIPGGTEHDGCINVIGPKINTGINLKKIKSTNWQSLATAIKEKVYIYSLPNREARRKGWIVQQDVAGVVEQKGDFTNIQYVAGSGKVTDGWVITSDIEIVLPTDSLNN